MSIPRSITERMQTTIDNQKLDIQALTNQIETLNKKLDAAKARNQDLRELVRRQASELVAKDRMILLLQKELTA